MLRSAEVLYVVSVLAFVMYLLYVMSDLHLGLGWLLLFGLTSVFLVLTPWTPPAAIVVFVILAYGPPRYDDELAIIHSNVPLVLVSLFALAGWIIWMVRGRKLPPLTHPLSILMLAFTAWLALTAFIAHLDGFGWRWASYPKHHPIQYAEGLLMFLLASEFLGKRQISLIFSLVLALVLAGRCMAQGTSGIYLDGDVGSLIPIVLPIIGLIPLLARDWPTRVLCMGLTALLFVMFAYTHNRAGAVAFLVSLIVILWQYRRRWRVLALGVPIVMVALVLIPSAYVDRFRVLWDPDAQHATARLDRSTIEGRYNLWRGAGAIVSENPWVGVGPGNYPITIGKYAKGQRGYIAHNNYLNIATDAGAIGLLLYVILFGLGLILTFRVAPAAGSSWPITGGQMLQASLTAYLVAGLFISRQDMVLAYLLLGWIAALDIEKTRLMSERTDNQ